MHAHLGLPPHAYGDTGGAALADAIGETWPTFAGRTGWRLESEYPPIPERLRAMLAEFYRPHNRALAELLGEPELGARW